jgi:hypothetical protein
MPLERRTFYRWRSSLDCDRAQAETSLAGAPITGGTHDYNPDFFRR